MTGRTPEGQRAYGLLEWAGHDPAARSADAMEQVRQIGIGLLGTGNKPALAEVGDVMRVLGRMAPDETRTQ